MKSVDVPEEEYGRPCRSLLSCLTHLHHTEVVASHHAKLHVIRTAELTPAVVSEIGSVVEEPFHWRWILIFSWWWAWVTWVWFLLVCKLVFMEKRVYLLPATPSLHQMA